MKPPCCNKPKTRESFYWKKDAPHVKVDSRCKECLIKSVIEKQKAKKEERLMFNF